VERTHRQPMFLERNDGLFIIIIISSSIINSDHTDKERGRKRSRSTVSSNSAVDEGGRSTPRLGRFTPGKALLTDCCKIVRCTNGEVNISH
jgi:hypothetical protein